jgi:hypothetical protein
MKIIDSRENYCERIKDMRFILSKINENCFHCNLLLKDARIRDRLAAMQADTEKHIELLARAIDVIEGP